MLVFVYTIIYVLGGTQPDVTVVTGDPMSKEQCERLAAAPEVGGPTITDPVTGRPVIATFYKCIPQDPEQQIRIYQESIANGDAA